jgi:hypothetical protein
VIRRNAFSATPGLGLLLLLVAVPVTADTGSAGPAAGGLPERVEVVPYQKRMMPSHEIMLRDGRVLFAIDIEMTETQFIVLTSEEETLHLDRGEVLEMRSLRGGQREGR